MSTPSNLMRPAVGSMRRMMSFPRVDFPQPDSPDDPDGLALLHAEGDTVDGVDVADDAVEDAAADGEVFDDAADFEEGKRRPRLRSWEPGRSWCGPPVRRRGADDVA